jgi:hypothetical protein
VKTYILIDTTLSLSIIVPSCVSITYSLVQFNLFHIETDNSTRYDDLIHYLVEQRMYDANTIILKLNDSPV